MKNEKFEIESAQSKIEWVGRKVTGSHNGTIVIKKGEPMHSSLVTWLLTIFFQQKNILRQH